MITQEILNNRILSIILIIVIGFFIYSHTLAYTFQYDDYPVIVNNPLIEESNIITIWNNLYNPSRFIAYVSFAANYAYGGLNVIGFRLTNIIIHICTALMVRWLLLLICRSPQLAGWLSHDVQQRLSFSVAIIFAVHPVQTEAVTYITQRFTSLAALFYVASLCFYLKGRLIQMSNAVSWRPFVLSALMAVCAMLSKQTALTLPVMIGIIELYFFSKPASLFRQKKSVWIILGVLVGFLCIIPSIYSFDVGKILLIKTPSGSHLGDMVTLKSYLLTQFRVVVKYIQLMFVPLNQNLLYDFTLSKSLFDSATWSCLFILMMIGYAAFKLFKNYRILSFGLVWFFVTLLVESSIIPIKYVIFEHRLYLPSIGMCLFFVGLCVYFLKNPRLYFGMLVSVVIVLSCLTVLRNRVWEDGVSLWSDVTLKSPNHSRAQYNLGYEYLKLNQLDDALAQFTKALELNPHYFQAYANRSQVFISKGQFDLAMKDLDEAIRLNPDFAISYMTKGDAHRLNRQWKEALQNYNKALVLDEDMVQVYINRAITYINTGRLDLAVTDLDQAILIDHQQPVAYNTRHPTGLILNIHSLNYIEPYYGLVT